MDSVREEVRAALGELWQEAHREGQDSATAFEWGASSKHSEHEDAMREAEDAIMSALKRVPGVVVSPLVWEQVEGASDDGDAIFAICFGGLLRYEMWESEHGWAGGLSTADGDHSVCNHDICADTLEAAKAACQADFTKRITSAVEPSCVVTDEVEIDEPSIARDEPTVTVETHGGGIAGVDESIAPLVKLLNDGGIATAASCSGHGQRPGNIALADGRELIIARNWNEARLIDGLFPGINGEPAKGIEGALEFIRQSSEDVRADERRAWRPGDVVRHKPSGEEWVILRIDLDSDSLIPAGWPKSRARVSDCVFVKAGDPNSYVGGEIARSLTNGGK